MTTRVGVLGDFNPAFRSHPATNEALGHAAEALDLQVAVEWIPTPSLREGAEQLRGFDAIVASSGSPYRDMQGMLAGIQWARVNNWPFTGA